MISDGEKKKTYFILQLDRFHYMTQDIQNFDAVVSSLELFNSKSEKKYKTTVTENIAKSCSATGSNGTTTQRLCAKQFLKASRIYKIKLKGYLRTSSHRYF